MGSNQYCAGRVYDYVCLLYDWSTRRLTESGFMENSGIKPVTPGLQGIGLSPTPPLLNMKTNKSNSITTDQTALSEFTLSSPFQPLFCHYFCPENIVCFLRLLHIFKCNPDNFINEANNMNPDQTALKGAV